MSDEPVWSFSRAGDGPGYVARLDGAGRAVLLDVIDEVLRLLGDPLTSPVATDAERWSALTIPGPPLEVPQDPAVRRLLPDASPDADVAAEFRRLTEDDLRATKAAGLRALRAAVDAGRPEVLVVPSEAGRVAAALTDLRLVLSERLGVRDDDDAEAVYRLAAEEEPPSPADSVASMRHFLAAVYAVLTLLQESLVGLMLEELPGAAPGRPGTAPA